MKDSGREDACVYHSDREDRAPANSSPESPDGGRDKVQTFGWSGCALLRF